ncbi:NAD(P)/FAD-dependent oxidoreductase [Burkholderia gladioli]|uniref:FAD-dependent pyridine nucleotide-disulfide oxidoreductase n=1 Tax=Burkholderia gladioli (strain BSR3) TaxID=999541 RepID=F2LQK8_BURGS|nr:FAD-dependent oxidoreductase [Burkholderia gladioli]AEA64868.1 FAD-dependent pyridine nucleotide-disulfide oxidoreductase [Burkholderia gladioli BSR3]MBW5283350.1 FAD-dependent oxidoreductase [Burkholderia gladioli]
MDVVDVLIVGAGHAGANCAMELRKAGFEGSVMLLSDETELPYERPPLTKDYFTGDRGGEQIRFRTAEAWLERGIEVRLAHRVEAIEPEAHRVRLADDATLQYGKLVWAAGGTPRRLACEGATLAGVHVIRAKHDIDALKADLAGREHVVIVGGGYVGLEAAASLTKLGGVRVTVVEAQDRLLARVAGEPLSAFIEGEHRARGVEIVTGAQVAALKGRDGRVSAVELADGRSIAADLVIAGIGIVPTAQLLLDAGAQGGNGVDVDEQCRTTLPDVYAIGDCARRAHPLVAGAALRIESVPSALEHAQIVAASITGKPAPKPGVPWFWSTQYDLRIQMAGIPDGYDEVAVRGDLAARSFLVLYLRGGRLIALDAVNATKDYVQGRALLAADVTLTREQLEDLSVPLQARMPVASA